MPRFSDSTRPASFNLAMWCEMVGWLKPRPAVKSQMQMGPSAFDSAASIVTRVGSASAFMSSARRSAQALLTLGIAQQTPRSRITGKSLTATKEMIRYPSMVIDGFSVKVVC